MFNEEEVAEFHLWKKKFERIRFNLLENGDKDKSKLQSLEEDLESNLQLLGVSALEDRLQAEVPECISDLREAGIKVWLLTGDKLETAESIGFSSKLFSRDMDIFRVQGNTLDEVRDVFVRIEEHMIVGGKEKIESARRRKEEINSKRDWLTSKSAGKVEPSFEEMGSNRAITPLNWDSPFSLQKGPIEKKDSSLEWIRRSEIDKDPSLASNQKEKAIYELVQSKIFIGPVRHMVP